MSKRDDKRRVLIAVTESTPLAELWRATIEHLAGASAEVVAVIVTDDRWRRAASLSFTREISRVSGSSAEFTPKRAEQVGQDSLMQLQMQIQKLALEADLRPVFEILSEHDPADIEKLMGLGETILIAPSFIVTRPIYAQLTRLNCQVLLVEVVETQKHNP